MCLDRSPGHKRTGMVVQGAGHGGYGNRRSPGTRQRCYSGSHWALIGVQIKLGNSYFRNPTDDGWWFSCDVDHVSYWLGHSLPVLVSLCDLETKRISWQHVSEQTVVHTGKGGENHVTRSQELTKKSTAVLRPLARSSAEVPVMAAWLTSQVEPPQQDAFYMHLLSARLYARSPATRPTGLGPPRCSPGTRRPPGSPCGAA